MGFPCPRERSTISESDSAPSRALARNLNPFWGVIRSVRNEQHYLSKDWDSESLAHDAPISRLKYFRIKTVGDD